VHLWLLLPHEQAVEVWAVNTDPQRLEQIQLLDASGELSGLQQHGALAGAIFP